MMRGKSEDEDGDVEVRDGRPVPYGGTGTMMRGTGDPSPTEVTGADDQNDNPSVACGDSSLYTREPLKLRKFGNTANKEKITDQSLL